MRKGQKMTPEAKANWLAAVRKTNNKPGSKMPASGMEADGGAGDHAPRAAFIPETRPQPTPEQIQAAHQANMTALELCKPHLAKAIGRWVRNLDSDSDQAANVAADKIVERVEGKAVERVINVPPPVPVPIDLSQLTEAQLDALQEVLLMTERPEQKKIEGKETE
jgi:hypothetical protein